MAPEINVGGTQAYLIVPSEFADDILANGYVCRGRDAVPGHVDRGKAVKGMLKHASTKEGRSKCLEVHGVPEEWIKVAESGEGCRIETPDTKELDGTERPWLKPEYLRSGTAMIRGAEDFLGKGCMFCGREDTLDSNLRKKIGEAEFFGEAYLCSPCSNPDCIDKMVARSKRLDEGPTMILYHKTSKTVADSVKGACKGKMIRGDFFDKAGAAGGGIYAGHTARECSWKYEAKGPTTTLKLRCQMGTALECPYMYQPSGVESNEMLKHLLSHPDGPYDSVILDRAAKDGRAAKFPLPDAPVQGTRIEDITIGEALHPGYEFVFYTWDQIEVIDEVDEDPVPPGYDKEFKDGVWVRES